MNRNNNLTTRNYNVDSNVLDITVDDLGYLYAIYDDGFVAEYDPNGNLIFAYDIVSSTSNILGLIQNPSSIQVDEHNNIFVVDMGKSEIITYQPTSFTNLVHMAINDYNIGNYESSTELFENILKQNDNFALAHSALGKAYYQNNDLDNSLKEYYKANDVQGYSNTYWKIRDLWLKDNLSILFIVIIIFIAVINLIKFVNKKTTVFSGVNNSISQIKTNKNVRKYSFIFKIFKQQIT